MQGENIKKKTPTSKMMEFYIILEKKRNADVIIYSQNEKIRPKLTNYFK